MNAIVWLEIAALGIIFGAVGQGARTIVGFKKLNDYASDTTVAAELVDGVRLLMSFGIGGVAGALAAITLITDPQNIAPQQLFAIAAAGYSGSDFIEGFITKISGAPGSTIASAKAGAAKAPADDAVG